MKILAYPRDDSSPYQRLLYGEMHRMGIQVAYLGRLTPSHTLNLLLLPVELAVMRLRGYRVVHLHWVHGFAMTGAHRFPALRRIAQAWFSAFLKSVRVLRIRLVWTAHNVLPHEPVFADDMKARLQLVHACDLVFAHSRSALAELAALGLAPRRTAVIAHGQLAPSLPAGMLRTPGSGLASRRLIFCGRVREYKGVEDLLTAFATLPPDINAQLVVVGECDDSRLRPTLLALAADCGGRATLRLERVSDQEVSSLLADADAVILPVRRVTTSGSAMLALSHGRPLVVPALAAFADLPDDAILRYDGTTRGLAEAMAWTASADSKALAAMSEAACRYAATLTWPEIAATTAREIRAVLGEQRDT
jgi:glycosyltransferase involved in cell wall biosynthesis